MLLDGQVRYWSLTSLNITQMISDKLTRPTCISNFQRSNSVTWCCLTRSTCISIGLAPTDQSGTRNTWSISDQHDACQQLDVCLPSPRDFRCNCCVSLPGPRAFLLAAWWESAKTYRQSIRAKEKGWRLFVHILGVKDFLYTAGSYTTAAEPHLNRLKVHVHFSFAKPAFHKHVTTGSLHQKAD